MKKITVTAYRTGRQNKAYYKVVRISENGRYKEFTYTNEDLPKTIKEFMQTHSFERLSETKIRFS